MTSREKIAERLRQLAVSYHWEYTADYPAERDEILKKWNSLAKEARAAGMSDAEISKIFLDEEASARRWRRKVYDEYQDGIRDRDDLDWL